MKKIIALALVCLNSLFGGISEQVLPLDTKISSQSLQTALDQALDFANGALQERNLEVEGCFSSAKEPIYLTLLQADRSTKPIGITHFAKLTPEFEVAEFTQVARTIEELALSILKAVQIHLDVKSNADVLITAIGTPFYKNGVDISIENGILHIDNKPVSCQKPSEEGSELVELEAFRLTGEEGLTFEKLEEGSFAVKSSVDLRKGKGIFFKLSEDGFRVVRG